MKRKRYPLSADPSTPTATSRPAEPMNGYLRIPANSSSKPLQLAHSSDPASPGSTLTGLTSLSAPEPEEPINAVSNNIKEACCVTRLNGFCIGVSSHILHANSNRALTPHLRSLRYSERRERTGSMVAALHPGRRHAVSAATRRSTGTTVNVSGSTGRTS